ncbi:hypothetical protein A2572_01045 [Candidatus Collierbacteria bacterium RIFOXYD1_FULL_40_9]|uniref:Uncharacterized protein n=1 Tax=Candidatus Collierbacteria bacterium RIFOXYD1_FULL_40_9 TaxID=1817731 RepID=A0A1F5FTU6_9BACT|nr:MAG: hypothetical protein A2572_01045 [Candidatus Collierbacteria bacterium RIFOXYD1_FULL_40_9]
MIYFYLLLSLTALYYSGRVLLFQLTHLIHRVGGDRRFLIIIWSLIFLPGTIIHELSHFFMAILVGARTGKIEVFPEFLDTENPDGGVALGSVQTPKLNIIQGVLVGLAPALTGLGLLVWLGSLILQSYNLATYQNLAFQIYLFFTVSNSFFPSRTDLNHAIPAAITAAVCIAIAWLVGVQFSLSISDGVASVSKVILVTILLGTTLNLFISFIFFILRKAINR